MRSRPPTFRLVAAAALLGLAALAPAATARDQQLVVGGSPASAGEYPWMAALYNLSADGGQFCGGTVVKPTFVVTAAHCVALVVPGATRVLVGRNALNGTGGQSIIVLAAEVHPLYNAVTNENDVAVLRLAGPSQYGTLPWAVPAQSALWAPGVTTTIIGWGLTEEDGDPSNVLLEATVPVVADTTCDSAYGGAINPAVHLCAGNMASGGVDTCQGDSGGPLMVKNGTAFLLAGITSFGDGCARKNKPGVYTEVAAMASFISLATTA